MKPLLKLLLVIVFVNPVHAQTAEERLNQALENLNNFTADFTQTQLDDERQVVQQSRGELAIQRPGKFFWRYIEPFEQEIIADGSELWIYDVDLDQVTVKPLNAGLASAPIMILMKQNKISQEFTVNEFAQREILYWVELEPNSKDLEYSQVYIGLENDIVKAMELRDNFGQSTQIVFRNLRTDVIHNPKTFQFTPPDGVDVFGVGG